MSTTLGQVRKQPRTETFESLTASRRRHVLSILDDASPLPVPRLASLVAAFERGKPPTAVPDDAVGSVRADLAHVHVPALVDADLVERGPNGVDVTATGRRVLGEPGFRTVVETAARDWDDVIDCLADERRRIALDVLRGRDGGMGRRDLAQVVAAREAGIDDPASAAETVLTSLYHVHLPKLAEANLVELDDETVSYEGHPDLPVADTLRLLDTGRQ